MSGDLVMLHPFGVPVFMLLAGIALAFYGNRIVPFALVVCGLILGFFHGGPLLSQLTDNPEVLKYGPAVLAVLLAVVVSFLYRAAFFLAGVFIGFFTTAALLPDLSPVFAWVIALVSGALVYVSRNFVFSVLTALMGAGLTATGTVNLLAWIRIPAGVAPYWIIFVVIFFTGAVFQTKRNRGRK